MLDNINFTFSGARIRDAHYYEEDNSCFIRADYGTDQYEITLENVMNISSLSGFITGRQITYYTETPKGDKFEYHFSFVGLSKCVIVVSDKIKYKVF